MIKAFVSKVGEGKSLCMLIEAAAQEGKSVAYFTFELSERQIISRLDKIGVKASKFNICYIPFGSPIKTIKAKIKRFAEEYDIVCVDGIEITKTSLKSINEACFEGFMTQCSELWVTSNVNRMIEDKVNYLAEANMWNSKEDTLVKVKQVISKFKNPLIPNDRFIEVIDVEKKVVKVYNLSQILKNN